MNIYECKVCNHLQVGVLPSQGTCIFCGAQKVGEDQATRRIDA